MASQLHISISAEPVFTLGNFVITNSILTTWIVTAFLITVAVGYHLAFGKRSFQDKPTKLQSLFEFIIESLYNLTHSISGSHHKARIFFPFIASFFLFIMFSNWSGLLPGVGTVGYMHQAEAAHEESPSNTSPESATTPGSEFDEIIDQHGTAQVTQSQDVVPSPDGHDESPTDTSVAVEQKEAGEEHSTFVPYFRAPTADINTTLALALFSIITVQIIGVKFLNLGYFKKYIDLRSPIYFIVGLLEIMSEISRIISFAFRLFGNIFAGEVLLTVIAFLIPLALPIPFLGLEIFVGFIQALVFSLLTLVFLSTATASHAQEH